MPTWLAILLSVDAVACAGTVVLGRIKKRRKEECEDTELEQLGREFPISIHDRRSPLHPIGTPPLDRHHTSKAGRR